MTKKYGSRRAFRRLLASLEPISVLALTLATLASRRLSCGFPLAPAVRGNLVGIYPSWTLPEVTGNEKLENTRFLAQNRILPERLGRG